MDTINARRFQLVELQVITALVQNSQLYFQDQPQLRSQPDQIVIVDAIECYNEETVANAPSGRDVVPNADLLKCFLTVNIQGTDEMKYIPLTRLQPIQSAGVASVFNPLLLDQIANIDWTKSYITSTDTVAINQSFLFGVYYRYQPMQQMR